MTEQPEKLLGYNQNYIKRLPNILYTWTKDKFYKYIDTYK
jgi:hypothetical protein